MKIPPDAPEVSQSTIEALKQAPVKVVWFDEGFETTHGLFDFGGALKPVFGAFFDVIINKPSVEDDDDPPAYVSGDIEYDDTTGDKYIQTGTMRVDQKYRQNGLGERLLSAIACIAVEQDCVGIKTQFSHVASLKMSAKIFGQDRIHFLNKDGERDPNISYEDALETIAEERKRVLAYGVMHGQFKHRPKTDDEIGPGAVNGVRAWIDTERLDTSGLKKPIETGVIPDEEHEKDQES